jgi:hypothetical protein
MPGVALDVIALSASPRPLRLLGIFAASAAFFAILAAALYAALWIVEDQRQSQVAGIAVQPDFDLPEGLVAVQVVEDAAAFEDAAGFSPFVPDGVPDTTQDESVLAVTMPDDGGRRYGRVAFPAKDGAAVDGITGPAIVVLQAPGPPGDTIDGALKRLTTGSGRALAALLPCNGLVLDVQLYFGPDPQDGEPFVTPYMTSVAEAFVARVREQCAAGD